ncbi:ribose 5-phosphate isomerase B [Carnobacterium viridans]|uniref:Ribose-5-phosphate isomerase n=1 Tax=Carnobacterium viridans TaxID=174587 RepID=A0A1H0XI35_9LACT|nr:ribose 5-phosphate isomerase B [Carnobacterium viridans]SDQ02507.1 ribose-5-phosphate isomerase [Carnobacterium viridans]SDQ02547.1 ribose-5-phosphate isomerase [Carnobacterium viridans]
MKIAIGSDHVGYELKPAIIDYLEELGHEVNDFGPYTTERTDYPIFSKKVAENVANHNFDLGILICGTGVGISIAANKVEGIRAVVCSEPYSAKLSREHNNTNILAFGSRVIGTELAKMIVKEWLDAEYEGGRHENRVNMISEIEKNKR